VTIGVMNATSPLHEAQVRIGDRYEARILEPSPPAVVAEPWFADDPPARGEVPPGRPVVSALSTGDLTWAQLATDDEELARWCEERWLGPYRRLAPVPGTLVQTRLGLHRLAEHVVSPARRHVNGKIGLRYTRGGFGTPFFGADEQVRVVGGDLVVQRGGEERRAAITTLAAAADHVGRTALPDDLAVDDTPLQVEARAASFLGDWYGFAASVLEELRARADLGADPSRVQLWPEHFDLAVDLGRETGGVRAGYGLSPGDDQHPELYLYVAPWVAPPAGELWGATGFTGAELTYEALLEAEDQRATALEFFLVRLAALSA
jgi:hypothetical protein